jgi:hypothetical protein
VERQRELVEHECPPDTEDDGDHVASCVVEAERDVDHAACEHEDETEHHVVHVHAADPAARPRVAAREPGVEAHEHEGPERGGEQEQQCLAIGQPVPVKLYGVAEHAPEVVEMLDVVEVDVEGDGRQGLEREGGEAHAPMLGPRPVERG